MIMAIGFHKNCSDSRFRDLRSACSMAEDVNWRSTGYFTETNSSKWTPAFEQKRSMTNGRFGACQIDFDLVDVDIFVVVNCLGLASEGITTKSWTTQDGHVRSGTKMDRKHP